MIFSAALINRLSGKIIVLVCGQAIIAPTFIRIFGVKAWYLQGTVMTGVH